MTGILYENKSDNLVVDKTINQKGSALTLHFKDDSEVINPTIYISRNTNMINCNYIYIQDLHRYYYITKIDLSTQCYIVHCHVDVLMSYRSMILKQKAVVRRNAENYNLYLPDDKLKTLAPSRQLTIPFTSGFLSGGGKVHSYILTLNGGGAY